MTRNDFLKSIAKAAMGLGVVSFLPSLKFGPDEAEAAGQKITARIAATTPLSGADIFALIQGGLDRKATLTNLFGISGILTASRYGLVSSTTVDQTTLLQSFLDLDTSSGTGIAQLKVIDVLHIKTTAPLTLPASGTRITGVGSGGDFANYLIPTDCRAFTIASVHNSSIENLMIWPQGTSAPADIVNIDGSYNITFRNVMIRVASTYIPSTAVVIQGSAISASNDILWDHCIVRSDGSRFPIGFQFANACGTATLVHQDLETCDRGIQHNGGNITVINPYTERFGVNVLDLQPSADASASFTCTGGQLVGDGTSVPIAVRSGCKNTRITSYTTRGGASGAKQGHIYGLTGAANIKIDLVNFDPTLWGTSVALDSSVLFLPPLRGTATWNPGDLVDGAGESKTDFTVTGAALAVGQRVEVSPPYDLQGITCNGWVSATDTVSVRLQNETGGSINLASGTWTVVVRRD